MCLFVFTSCAAHRFVYSAVAPKLPDGLMLKDLENKALEKLSPILFKFEDVHQGNGDHDFASFVDASASGATKPARRNGRSQGEFLNA